jgi:MerR family transcriptional regulator, light-induced transcriptional regulator
MSRSGRIREIAFGGYVQGVRHPRALLTSTEAADYLGASPTSVKRWADEGLLRCVKTAGKHRRFSVEELERFRHERMGALSDVADLSTNAVQAWLDDLRTGRMHRLRARLLDARAELGGWRAVGDRLVPVIEELEGVAKRNEMSSAEHRIAINRLARALMQISDAMIGGEDGPRALLATLDDDEDTLGLAMIEVALRELGWQTVWVGSLPAGELGSAVDAVGAQLIALSALPRENGNSHIERAERAGEIAREREITLLFAGRGKWPDAPTYGARVHELSRIGALVPSF